MGVVPRSRAIHSFIHTYHFKPSDQAQLMRVRAPTDGAELQLPQHGDGGPQRRNGPPPADWLVAPSPPWRRVRKLVDDGVARHTRRRFLQHHEDLGRAWCVASLSPSPSRLALRPQKRQKAKRKAQLVQAARSDGVRRAPLPCSLNDYDKWGRE